MSLINVENLSLDIGDTPILKDIDLSVSKGEVLGLVGESGSGKSMTALAMMQLLPRAATTNGQIQFDGRNLLTSSEEAMCQIRGNEIGMVFQEPMTALNPVKTIGEQVAEGVRWHKSVSRAEAEEVARTMLERVGLPESRFPLTRFPHELSGGQRQRVVIAIACALKPKLLIADEPTTALDVVLQAQILDLLKDLINDYDMGLLLISHDLAVVAEMADRIAIMRSGEIVEAGETGATLSEQKHPYTRQLAEASTHRPTRSEPQKEERQEIILSVRDVKKHYRLPRENIFKPASFFKAVDGVSFDIAAGQSISLVGRSGCGKSTLARLILALDKPTEGEVEFMSGVTSQMDETTLRPYRRNMQIVFQDPYGSFDPRHKVERLVTEPLHLLDEKPSGKARTDLAVAALESVGLSSSDLAKYPHEFSGGQRQRISIARAIINKPKLIVCDEPVSALDVSVRAHILDLFADLSERLGVAYLFITHDLNVARAITEEVMVMHEGLIVERGSTEDVLSSPQSEAAKNLVSAMPVLEAAIARRNSKFTA
ncbi:MAG: dipeptide ABC transporter ATP-binding protein [Pseudomonadota bacterium]